MRRVCLTMVVLLVCGLTGCTSLTPATVDALRQQAVTARATAGNFQQMAPRLVARDHAEGPAVDMWRVQHAVNLEAQATGLEALARRVSE